MGWWILVAIVVLVVLWLVFTYNGLISARNRTQEAWSEIDVEIKRRSDLITYPVTTVYDYIGYERATPAAATYSRTNACSAGAPCAPASLCPAASAPAQGILSPFAASK